MSVLGFEFAGGSIPGRDHLGRSDILVGRNNQDALLWQDFGDSAVAVVCDGCGSSPHSEVGAKILARLVISAVRSQYLCLPRVTAAARQALPADDFWEAVRNEALANLRILVLELAGASDQFERTVRDYCLSTVVGVLLCPEGAALFSIGDGIIALNGEILELGPFPNNEPPYLAYGLLSRTHAPRFMVRNIAPLESIDSLLIGTDGVSAFLTVADRRLPGKKEAAGPLQQFWTESKFFRNPDAVRRRLALMNSEVRWAAPDTGRPEIDLGLLRDDTTLVVARRALPKEVHTVERGLPEGQTDSAGSLHHPG
ncbi:MAG: protein phosphatase 2C domain-containing protein [Oligoflexia bacterium]|nr:protein phosphatase 2C domain-containing protein [Oligoflexia bacterium]